MRTVALLLVLAPLAACVHTGTTFSYTAIHEALPRLHATGEAYVASARPQAGWLHMSDTLRLEGGGEVTTQALVAPCPLLRGGDAPDGRQCPLDAPDGPRSATHVEERPDLTVLLWGSLALLLASVIEPIACWTACHDQGWEIA